MKQFLLLALFVVFFSCKEEATQENADSVAQDSNALIADSTAECCLRACLKSAECSLVFCLDDSLPFLGKMTSVKISAKSA